MLCVPLHFCFGFSLCFRRFTSPPANGALVRLKIRLLDLNRVPEGWTHLIPHVVSFSAEHAMLRGQLRNEHTD
jgi:hypothetical protein